MSDRQALEIKVEAALRREAPVAPGARVLLGVSGGADSVALLHALAALAPQLKFELRAAHLNHGWRGRESANDARFVNALCKRLGVPCTIEKLTGEKSKPPPPGGREARARAARYAFLERAAHRARCHRVAVAHHRDDLAETVLINLLRGSGPLGLSGFAPLGRCGALPLIRPLIQATRAEIEAYCRDRRLRCSTPHRPELPHRQTVHREGVMPHRGQSGLPLRLRSPSTSVPHRTTCRSGR